MRIGTGKGRQTGDDNIVPMINVVFLLLIFFLLAGTLSPRPPFELDPVITRLKPPSEAPSDGLYVSATGELYFRGQMVGLESLPSLLEPAAGPAAPPRELVVDRRLRGETLMPVLDALAGAGIAKVRLVTRNAAE